MIVHPVIITFCQNRIMNDEYKLVFEDSFESLDRNIWKFDIGKGPRNDGWGNGEEQTYTDDKANVFVEDGVLHVRALKDDNGNFTSARLTTYGTYEFSYGKITCEARVREAPGPFSAIWALSSKCHDESSVRWPLAGEIDLFEYHAMWPYTPATLHYKDCHGGNAESFKGNLQLTSSNREPIWHEYTVEWTPDYIAFFQDKSIIGKKRRPDSPTQENWPYHKDNPFHLIINNAVNPSWSTTKATDEFTYHDLEVKYISVYQK